MTLSDAAIRNAKAPTKYLLIWRAFGPASHLWRGSVSMWMLHSE